MEPKIYKPSIYNAPTVYNKEGGVYNGSGVYKDGSINAGEYYTVFSNFDTVEKIDNPIIGPQTNYKSNNISYIFENDYLKATSLINSNSNVAGLSFVKKNGTILETEFVISHPNGNPPNFIWCGDFGFDNDYARNDFEFLVDQTKQYSVYNGVFRNRTDAGYNWFSYPETAGVNFFKVKLVFNDPETELYINDNLALKIETAVIDNQMFKIRPSRMNEFIKMKYLHITNAVSFDGGIT